MAENADHWTIERNADFAVWQAGHETRTAEIDVLKRRTQRLIDQFDEQQRMEKDETAAQIMAQSLALSDEQRSAITSEIEKASSLVQSGNCAEAAKLYRQVLEQEHGNLSAHFGWGRCLAQLGEQEEAARQFTDVITMPGDAPDARMMKTFAMLSMQQLPPPSDQHLDEAAVVFDDEISLTEIWDAPFAPKMTVVPAGEYTMGSPEDERFRLPGEDRHRVRIAYPLAFSTYNVTRGEFAHFVAATGHEVKGCNREGPQGMHFDAQGDWRDTGFEQDDNHPVTCVNFHDATAYAEWLSAKTGAMYRLPSEAEWEHAARGGTSTAYYWGQSAGTGNANFDGTDGKPGARKTTPGGAYPPNPFGLYEHGWQCLEMARRLLEP